MFEKESKNNFKLAVACIILVSILLIIKAFVHMSVGVEAALLFIVTVLMLVGIGSYYKALVYKE